MEFCIFKNFAIGPENCLLHTALPESRGICGGSSDGFCYAIFDNLRCQFPCGTSAHAVGTSKALQMGEVEGAMSGLSIAVAGVLTAVLCPIFVNFID